MGHRQEVRYDVRNHLRGIVLVEFGDAEDDQHRSQVDLRLKFCSLFESTVLKIVKNLRYQKWPKVATGGETFCGLFGG